MRRVTLIAGYVAFAAQNSVAYGQMCSHVAGEWSLINAETEDVLAAISLDASADGTADTAYCVVEEWDVEGSYSGGVLNFTATNPNDPPDPYDCAAYVEVSGEPTVYSCDLIEGVGYQPGIDPTDIRMTKSCDVPSEEFSNFVTWTGGTYGSFGATLFGGTGPNFGGRRVVEAATSGGSDTCYFPGSNYMPFVNITGGDWDVDTFNYYSGDMIGVSPDMVTYYRNRGQAPCSFHIEQLMQIECSAGPTTYQQNSLYYDISSTIVCAERDGEDECKLWP